MGKYPLIKRLKGLFDPVGTRKYVTQITLIILSLMIATSVDRCREASKNREKLLEYMNAIRVDLKDELDACSRNLHDCQRDIYCLDNTLRLGNQPDSIATALTNFSEVYWRGVFRSFPPTTFEIMSETGDAGLLKDIQLRDKLAGVFAFRRNIVQRDLEKFDEQTQQCAEETGRYVNLSLLLYSRPFDEACILDREGFLKSPHNEIVLLLRAASLRAFHLETAMEDLEGVSHEVDEFISKI